jgi:hypothetical protein
MACTAKGDMNIREECHMPNLSHNSATRWAKFSGRGFRLQRHLYTPMNPRSNRMLNENTPIIQPSITHGRSASKELTIRCRSGIELGVMFTLFTLATSISRSNDAL